VIAPRASDAPTAFGYSPPLVASTATANLEVARRYLAALEAGAVGDELAAFFSPDVEQIEFPNRLVPTGGRRGLPEMLEGARRGQQVLREQRYQVERAFADGNAVVLEVLWVGTLAIDRGSIAAGQELRAHFAVVLELRNGRIIAQRNYDCFDPF
jgi:ketosteroid isomerase-like protein